MLILFSMVLVGAGCSKDLEATSENEVAGVGAQIPNLSLEDANGNIINLRGDFQGKILVVNSWAGWCSFCKKELIDFASVQNMYPDDVVFIAINRAESIEKAKKFTDELNVTDQLVFLSDPEDLFYEAIGGFTMPETIFVDTKGNILIHKRGPMDVVEIRTKLMEALAKMSSTNQ